MAAHSSISFLVKYVHSKLTEENIRADIRCVGFQILTAVVTKNTACHLLSLCYLAQLMLRT
jgi:hypothetical protein